MGYRSEVAIGISKKARDLALEIGNWPEIFSEEVTSKETEEYVLYVFDSIKWYPSYDQVAEVEEFLEFLKFQVHIQPENSDNYGFVRVGEEPGDLEEHGDPYAYGIGYTQSIYFYED